jgi:hypothetical protein
VRLAFGGITADSGNERILLDHAGLERYLQQRRPYAPFDDHVFISPTRQVDVLIKKGFLDRDEKMVSEHTNKDVRVNAAFYSMEDRSLGQRCFHVAEGILSATNERPAEFVAPSPHCLICDDKGHAQPRAARRHAG